MKKTGYLEVIAGPMYCGKTEELIRLMKRASIAGRKIQVFKHKIDNRYGTDKKLYSHAGVTFDCDLVEDAQQILKHVKKETEIIAIDEAQWFGEALVDVVTQLLSQKKRIIVSGLAMTFDRQPFVPMPTLMAMADRVSKLSAVCSVCGQDAVFHKRLAKGVKGVNALVADPRFVSKMDASVFQARCRNCFNKS